MRDLRARLPLFRRMTPETHIGKISACEMGGVRLPHGEPDHRLHTGHWSQTRETPAPAATSIRRRPVSTPSQEAPQPRTAPRATAPHPGTRAATPAPNHTRQHAAAVA